ncbi:MAG: S-methyl-5-thioribose-1-phosphate isomerase [Bacteroidales bacterium]|nr:S-methyl-5-thioribose-1-phosphate isomerase [Bacteroidales bacterium]
MKIQETHYTAIWPEEDGKSVGIINQLVLPFKFEKKILTTVEQVYYAIAEMEVRGAPLIGVTAAFGMFFARTETNNIDELFKKAEYLKSSRPTAVNLHWAVDKVFSKLKISNTEQVAWNEAVKIFSEEIENCRLIGIYGCDLIEEISKKKSGKTVNILTHCNAGWLACVDYGTATAPIYEAHNRGIDVHVWVDETRPRNQGARLTAYELGEHGIKHTVIADNTGGHLMQHGMVDLVIVGSDRTTGNGDVANKIGTYLKALAAKDNNLPFYVALPLSTIDISLSDGIKEIPIEQRNEDEVLFIEGWDGTEIKKLKLTPENSNAANFGFDVTPARLVTGLITEKGICRADRESIEKLF